MGWLGTIKKWTLNTTRFAWGTTRFVGNNFRSLGSVVTSLTTNDLARRIVVHEPARYLAKQSLYIVKNDLLPLATTQVALAILENITHYGDDYLSDKDNDNWISPEMLLQCGLSVISAMKIGLLIYQCRQQIKFTSHMAVLIVEAPGKLNKGRSVVDATLKIALSNTMSYWATEGMIFFMRHLPYFSSLDYGIRLLSMMHAGRFIATAIHPRQNQQAYLNKHVERIVSIGLFYQLITYAASKTIESLFMIGSFSTGLHLYIPPTYYAAIIEQFALILTFIVVANQTLPAAREDDAARRVFDVVGLYQAFILFIFETLFMGAKATVPTLFDQEKRQSFMEVVNTISRVLNYPVTKLIKFIFLPSMFHNWRNFKKDALIAPYWADFREKLIQGLTVIKSVEDMRLLFIPVLPLAQRFPRVTAKVLRQWKSVPRKVTKGGLSAADAATLVFFGVALEKLKLDKIADHRTAVTAESRPIPIPEPFVRPEQKSDVAVTYLKNCGVFAATYEQAQQANFSKFQKQVTEAVAEPHKMSGI